MRIDLFRVNDRKRQIQGPALKAELPCACGCSPLPYVLISNGRTGLSAKFESQKELDDFRVQVNKLKIPPTE